MIGTAPALRENTGYSQSEVEGTSGKKSRGNGRLARVGFISKFMGLFEPHGSLLDGVMASLRRDRFRVIGLPVVRTDGKPLAPAISRACDEVHEVPLSHHEARALVGSLQLDMLIFADTLSEPVTHFMSHCRLASVQIAFWGNPVTSGSPHIDYFVSADSMEHPHRTRLRGGAGGGDGDPYSEQVVLLDGQGIWYHAPRTAHEDLLASDYKGYRDSPAMQSQMGANYSRESFGLSPHWFILLCPQSAFKIHPLFDRVLARILSRTPDHVRVVVTGGHREAWTKVYRRRLYLTADRYDYRPSRTHNDSGSGSGSGSGIDAGAASRSPRMALRDRLHVIPRVSSEKFHSLLRMAEAVLHPFPSTAPRPARTVCTQECHS